MKYADVAPYLAKLTLNSSNYNNAAQISADDYFTTNQYEGKIYKTNNLQGRVLANYCKNDSDLVKEQKRIEKELLDVENHVWGRDSAAIKKMEAERLLKDSLARAASLAEKTTEAKSSAKVSKASRSSSKQETSNSSRSQTKRQKSTTTFSVRRQRH